MSQLHKKIFISEIPKTNSLRNKWRRVTVQESQVFDRPDSRVFIGLWTIELGPIAFEVSQRAIDVLRKNLATAEKKVQQNVHIA